MGIVRNWVVRAGQKMGDSADTLAQLGPEQLSRVQAQKDEYMSEMPNPKDPQAVELTARLLAENGVEIFSSYLSQIRQLYTPLDPTAEYGREFEPNYNIRYFNITKWVTDKEENSLEKLVNVYAVLSNEDCNIALVFNRTREKTNVYLAVVNTLNRGDNYEIETLSDRIESAIRGNFPGAEIGADGHGAAEAGRIPCLNRFKDSSVAIASNVPTEKSEKFISQTIEKLLDGFVPTSSKEDYTIILLATPVTDVEERKQELARIYSGLIPYEKWETNYTYTQSDSTSGMAIIGVNVGASAGVQQGVNQTISNSSSRMDSTQEASSDATSEMEGTNESKTDTTSENSMITDSTSDTETNTTGTNQSTATTFGSSDTSSIATGEGSSSTETIGTNESLSGNAGIEIGPVNLSGNYTHGTSNSSAVGSTKSLEKTISSTINKSATKTSGSSASYAVSAMSSHSTASGIGTALAKTAGTSFAKTVGRTLTSSAGRAVTNGLTKAIGTAKNVSLGANIGANFARSSTVTATIGKNEGITQHFGNFEITHALEVLKEQMKRYETGTALGMWDFAAYVLSDDFNIANNVAHSYLALTQGEESYMSDCSVNLWRNDTDADKEKAKVICKYLQDLRHPQFGLSPALMAHDKTFLIYPAAVTATATLSGKELAYSLNFPRKSIAGLPVFECAEFGRNVSSFDLYQDGPDSQMKLGKIFHMHSVEAADVNLSMNSLASHTFITGSTGAGKSNTVCKILEELWRAGGKFLVIEPAKGEYKNLFGNDEHVSVYGTNPKRMPLLRINPFSFPKSIHVLEHLDRLVEIFNVCWPMYAAMPAVLKNAVEKSYEDCGWDLLSSENRYGDDLYPSFADVARNIKSIIDSSEYDTENKGAYKGSLLTRLQSLTNGINGLIFQNDEISEAKLFDENVIVDLSRVGSSETKSLIMGVLVLKLQEYRMEQGNMNAPLKHITVLEEAHNLLKRTSSDQPVEGGNLLGKSVEMISNAIAEMRTYGEGFIIADQAPGLLDMAAIRNTNTKIIMRLPDLEDRILVGKAASLNDDQITELARLPRGVAAVYQNEWIQPVLCKVDRFDLPESPYVYQPVATEPEWKDIHDNLDIAELLSRGTHITDEAILKDIHQKLKNMDLDASDRVTILDMIAHPASEPRMTKIGPLMKKLFPSVYDAVKAAYKETPDVKSWTIQAEKAIPDSIRVDLDDQTRRDIIQSIITTYVYVENNDLTKLKEWNANGGLR